MVTKNIRNSRIVYNSKPKYKRGIQNISATVGVTYLYTSSLFLYLGRIQKSILQSEKTLKYKEYSS